MANPVADEILESYCTDSCVHALINNPTTEGINEPKKSSWILPCASSPPEI